MTQYEDSQELLIEAPEHPNPTTRSLHWKVLGAVSAVALLAVGSYVAYSEPVPAPQKANPMDFVQDWEEIPGIDTVIEHAKSLELKQPLRNLNDLFYESQPFVECLDIYRWPQAPGPRHGMESTTGASGANGVNADTAKTCCWICQRKRL